MMNYKEALKIIEQANQFGSILGLENITRLLGLLGNPQNKCNVIHIAGTNGKGSILAYLNTIYQTAGYSVGRYISPTIFEYRERFQINDQYISEEDFTACMEQVHNAIKDMLQQGYEHPTVYEMETAISFLYFEQKQVDVVLLETGLGGRLDATNVVEKPICDIIASVSMDHMQFLGDSLDAIAREKAGIIKKNTLVVTSPNEPVVCQVIQETCRERNAEFCQVMPEYQVLRQDLQRQIFLYKGSQYTLRMLGEHQIRNAITAIEVCRQNNNRNGHLLIVSEEQIAKGLADTVWQGRFEIVSRNPLLIRDGAHNEDAARRLRQAMDEYLEGYHFIYIMGVFADKDYKKMVEITAPLAHEIITITPDNPRALPATELAQEASRYCDHVTAVGSLEEAMQLAKKQTASRKDKTAIIMFGSLSFIGKAEDAIGE